MSCVSQSSWIENLPVTEKNIYPWITFLSEGNKTWLKMSTKEGITSFANRVIITTSEIYNTIYFEKVTFGEEGCCKQVEYIVEFDLQSFANKYFIGGELTGFHFMSWQKDGSFDFEMKNQKFNVQISKEKVLVTKKDAG